jgi:hypothetical protein
VPVNAELTRANLQQPVEMEKLVYRTGRVRKAQETGIEENPNGILDWLL